jgi:hypothetical protein
MRRTTRALAGAFAAAALVLITACEHDDVIPPPPATPGPDDIQVPDTPADPSALTPPGTELQVGQTAVVPFREGVLGITVTSVAEGDQEQFRADFADHDVDDVVAYYVLVTYENLSDDDFSHASTPRVRAVGEDGRITSVTVTGNSGQCVRESFPADAGQGTSLESCVLQAATTGEAVSGVRYNESDGGYDDDPIVWLQ